MAARLSELNSNQSFLQQEQVNLQSQETTLVGADLATAATDLTQATTTHDAASGRARESDTDQPSGLPALDRGHRELDQNMLGADLAPCSHQDACPFDHVSQFSNIPRPGMLLQQGSSFRAQHDVMRTEFRQETVHQSVQIFHAIAQRGQINRKDRQAVI